ncbi:DUF4912 domain-containing protein [Nodularia sphaerocarpa]|uniref:DUF4912 domain-containing protein n=1 Tax=Nodularia sphaerocarpa TaxID=137816 RepID=UPI002331091A|nr:DUF4912 domain-containing protein [Nodularia sphaerocarpa]MDB9373153.1 DUF4912 domain-containing protein [Nodularia sphaerocarpa CS-585]
MMWQQEKKDSAILSLALLLSLATTPMAVQLFLPTPVLAQSATEAESFPLPNTVENGTTVRIDGAMSLATINQSLKQSFEQQYSGTTVEVAANGADVAIPALIDGKVDLVAIARNLTLDEQAQGLAQKEFYRENIAIIVSTDNPFASSLTDQQFADIFRGKITNWSELGGTEAAIRFIDRPQTSDTRNTFRTNPFFSDAELTTGSNATQINEDNTAEIVKQLGNDGISYAMAHHVSQLPNVRVIPINETLPDNPNYPYSQPLVYAYRQNPSPNVASFLGFILASPEQQTIEAARAAAAATIAQGAAPIVVTPTPDPGTASAQPQPSEPPLNGEKVPLWWFLLPTAVIIALLLWVFRSRLWSKAPKNNTPDGDDSAVNEATIDDTSPSPALSESIDEMPFDDGAIGSIVVGEEVNDQEWGEINNLSNYLAIEWDEQLSPWDIEAPASLVNTLYPQLPDVSQVTSEQSQVADVGFDGENWDLKELSESAAAQPQVEPDLIEDSFSNETSNLAGDLDIEASIWSQIPDDDQTIDSRDNNETISPPSAEQISEEVTNSHPFLPDITEDILNVVADAAEPLEDETVSDLPEDREIFADNASFVGTSGGESTGNQGNPDVVEEVLNATIEAPLLELDGERNIVLQPRNGESADATWYIDETCQQALANNGISQLRLRLYDVTDLELSDQTPELVQEYELELGSQEKHIPIPQCDRDYLAEIGYLTAGDRWMKIAGSQKIRLVGIPLTDTTDENLSTADTKLEDLPHNSQSNILLKCGTPKWVYASWYISPTDKQTLQNHSISQLYLRLYDVTDLDLSDQTPHLVQQYECDEITSDLYVAIPATNHDYMAEIGYLTQGDRWELIVGSQTIRVLSRPQVDFWFVADVELIIHGSTEPGATVNVAGKPIKLKSDGTFHLRIPFSDDSINYMITAIAANGKDSVTIHKKFSQENSEV